MLVHFPSFSLSMFEGQRVYKIVWLTKTSDDVTFKSKLVTYISYEKKIAFEPSLVNYLFTTNHITFVKQFKLPAVWTICLSELLIHLNGTLNSWLWKWQSPRKRDKTPWRVMFLCDEVPPLWWCHRLFKRYFLRLITAYITFDITHTRQSR